MKRILLLVSFLSVFQLFSQEFNKWAVGLNLGAHDGIHYAGEGIDGLGAIHHFALNGRYMQSNRFGWKISSGYDLFKWKNLENSTKYFRVSAEAVFNFTDILHFDDFTKKFGLQSHVGFGYARMWNKEGINTNSAGTPFIENGPFDNMLHGIIGLTPLYKLNEHININMDLSYLFHLRQERTFDFREDIPSIGGFLGSFYNLSIGATYYIGKKSKHADWIYSKKITDDRILELNSQFTETKVGLEDDDHDGVINALDEEPNTTLGTIVNNKGISDSLLNGSSALTSDDIRNQLQIAKNYMSDDDKDGVINGVDEEKNTLFGAEVNSKGITITKNNLTTNLTTTVQTSDNEEIKLLKKELDVLKSKLLDDDKDGIINMVDEEPNSNPGATVNSKGIEIIKNTNTVENELSIYDVFFEIGSSTIDVNYKSLLDNLAKLLITEPNLIINATGFADKYGSLRINNKLSKDRVANCVNYVVSKGVSKDRFIISNKIISEQNNNNPNFDLNTINRRVSFSIKKQ